MSETKKVNKKKPGKFKQFFINIGKKCKDMFSELKRVTWPKMPTVIKQTGVVLGVVLVFLVLVTAIDYGFQALLTLVTQ